MRSEASFRSIADNSILEEASGTKKLSFGVTLTGAGTQTVSVQYASESIADASAPVIAGQDYISTSGILAIPAGPTFGTIDVKVFADTFLESDEVFGLVLSQPSSGVPLLNSSGQIAYSILATDDQAPDHYPTGNYDLSITAPSTPILIDVLANDTDLDGDILHIASGSGLDPFANSSVGGTVFRTADDKILFTPASNFTGVFSYTYVLDDGRGGMRSVFSQVIVAGDGTSGVTKVGTADNDVIVGTGGNDSLSGGFGDDVFVSGAGADRVDGGPGFDYLDVRQASHGATISFRDPWIWDDGDGGQDVLSNVEGVLGTRFDDNINGSSGDIQLISTGHRFYGNDGNDQLQSDAGDDVLDGGAGDDILIFGSGRDIVSGGLGNDQIYSFNGDSDTVGDILDGGPGDDFIFSILGRSADVVGGDDGNDYIQFGDGDVVTGGAGADTFFFGDDLGNFDPITAGRATITDLSPGDQIQWTFPTPVTIGNTDFNFIGPITSGTGTNTALDHVEYASSNGETTLYFGYDSTPGADFILTLSGTFGLDQFQIDQSTLPTLTLHIPVLIETFGSTSLTQVGNNYFFYANGTSSGPELIFSGAPVVAGQFAGWAVIGGEQTAGGYAVAWKNAGTGQYTVWNTDSNGNYLSNAVGVVLGSDSTLKSLEASLHQDLNGDGVTGLNVPTTVIESFGSTSLTQVGNNYFFYANGTSSGPELIFSGAPVVAGQFAGWAVIGGEQTAGGYEVAWKNAGTGQYTVWNTDSNGNYLSNAIGVVLGSDSTLKSLEASLHQDLNGDGVTGLNVPTTVIESFGSTSLTQVGNNYFFYANGTSSGPELIFSGAPVVAGQFAGWAVIGSELTAGGYAVAWKNAGTGQYTVWNTDSNGNYLSNAVGVVLGSDSTLKSLEASLHQDLNGDGVTGLNVPTTVIESFGSTSLTQVGNNYFFYANGTSSGPELIFSGAPVVAGQFAGWAVIGGEQTAGGYEVAWKNAGTGQYTVWNTDSNGNYLSNAIGVVLGSDSALQSLEASFHQDLNGNGFLLT